MSHIGKQIAHNSGPTFKFLFTSARCGFSRWCGTRPIWMRHRHILYVACHHWYHHRITNPVSRIVAQDKHKRCPWRSPGNENQRCEVGWPWWDRIGEAVMTRYVEYVMRLHSDGTCAASPAEATSSTCEQKLECRATVVGNSFSKIWPGWKVTYILNCTLIYGHGVH
jgi:hypothetical protein